MESNIYSTSSSVGYATLYAQLNTMLSWACRKCNDQILWSSCSPSGRKTDTSTLSTIQHEKWYALGLSTSCSGSDPPTLLLILVFWKKKIFFFFIGCTHNMQKFPGPGIKPLPQQQPEPQQWHHQVPTAKPPRDSLIFYFDFKCWSGFFNVSIRWNMPNIYYFKQALLKTASIILNID